MWKRILGLSLVSMLILALLLSGCTGGDTSTADNDKPEEPSNGGQPTETTESENQPVNLTWYISKQAPPDEKLVEDELNKQLETKLPNTTLDIVFLDNYTERVNMMTSAREEFDILWVADWMSPNYINLATKGAIMPIDDLIDKYMPTLKTAMPQYAWDGAKIAGKTYAVPNQQIMATAWGIMVVEDLANKYGLNLDDVKTVQDLEPFLQKVKENEPDIYPVAAGTAKGGNLMFMFPGTEKYERISGAPNGVPVIDRTSDDLKVINLYKTPEYKEFLAFARDWYEKGYIRQDIASHTDDTADRKNHKYAVLVPVIKPGGDVEASINDGIKYVQKALTEPWAGQRASTPTMNAISATSKNPDRAAMLLNLVNTDKEFYNTICFGIEDKHYKKIQDNPVVVEVIPDGGYSLGIDWMIGNVFNAYYRKGQQPGTWEETDKLNREAKVSPMLGFTLNPEPIKNEIAAATAVLGEYSIIELGAVSDWEAKLTEFQSKLDAAGAERIMQEVQRQLDEWKKTK